MKKAVVSIGITCYSAAETIARAVQSAMEQHYPDFEIVIVDDVSQDSSWDVILELQGQFPDKIRAFQNDKNLGVAGTRNRIITEAQGEFLAFFDDDDISVPSRLTRQVQRILDYERDFAAGHDVICHAARLQKYPDGREEIASTMGCDVGMVAPHGVDMAGRILYNKNISGGNGAMATCSQMARLSTYKNLGGFDPEFRRMEDTEFNVRLALSGGHFIGVADPLVVQTMTQADDKRIADERIYARKLYQKHSKFLLEEGRGHFDMDWLEAKHDYWEGYKVTFLWRLLLLFIAHPFLSLGRVLQAMPNMGYNRSVRKFHRAEMS